MQRLLLTPMTARLLEDAAAQVEKARKRLHHAQAAFQLACSVVACQVETEGDYVAIAEEGGRVYLVLEDRGQRADPSE